jgi:hypothetical protein
LSHIAFAAQRCSNHDGSFWKPRILSHLENALRSVVPSMAHGLGGLQRQLRKFLLRQSLERLYQDDRNGPPEVIGLGCDPFGQRGRPDAAKHR